LFYCSAKCILDIFNRLDVDYGRRDGQTDKMTLSNSTRALKCRRALKSISNTRLTSNESEELIIFKEKFTAGKEWLQSCAEQVWLEVVCWPTHDRSGNGSSSFCGNSNNTTCINSVSYRSINIFIRFVQKYLCYFVCV